jgi:hypothetical protein
MISLEYTHQTQIHKPELMPQQALRLVRKLEDCRLHWCEEPFPKSDLESYTRLAAATEISLAAGEREFGVQPFRSLIEKRCICGALTCYVWAESLDGNWWLVWRSAIRSKSRHIYTENTMSTYRQLSPT